MSSVHTILDTESLSKDGKLTTSFDALQNLDVENSEAFFLQFDLLEKDSVLDYTVAKRGELIYRASVPRNRIVFDINRKGELVVIGMDADRFSINEKGELLYRLSGTDDDSLFHDGLLHSSDKMYGGSELHSYPVL